VADSGELGTHTTQQPGGCALTALRDRTFPKHPLLALRIAIRAHLINRNALNVPPPFPLACADRSGELSFKEFQVMIQSNNSSTVHPARFESGCPHPFAPGTDGPGTDALIGPATYASAASRNIWLSAASKCVLRWPRCRRRP
jgi:hypothetical protein